MLALSIFAGIPAVSAAEGTFTTTAAFDTYFYIWAINGTIDDATPALVWNTTAEYFDFNVTITPNAGNSTIIEIPVPDCYMGMDIYEGVTTLKTGTANYTLSVPYAGNSTDVPALDWLALTAANGTGNDGIYKRVQLISNQTAATALTIRVYYATAPAVGFDGVDDYTSHADDPTLRMETPHFDITFKYWIYSNYIGFVSKFPSTQKYGYLVSFSNAENKLATFTANGTNYQMFGIMDSHSLGIFNVQRLISGYDLSRFYSSVNGTAQTNVTYAVAISYDATALQLGKRGVDAYYFKGIFYDVGIYNGTETRVLTINASSFSGGASTTVTDYSGAGNDGTAYGNVQYKVYTGTGFQFTLVDTAAPTYSGVAYSSAVVASSCTFSFTAADNIQLNQSIFSFDNGAGSYTNDSAVARSGTSAAISVAKTLSSDPAPTLIKFKWYLQDTAGNWNTTAEQTFNTTASGATTVGIFTVSSTGNIDTPTYDDTETGRLTIPCTTAGTVTVSGGFTGGSFIVEVDGAIYTDWTLTDGATITISGITAGQTVVVDFELDDEKHEPTPPGGDTSTPPVWSLPVDLGGFSLTRLDLTGGVAAAALALVVIWLVIKKWRKSKRKSFMPETFSLPGWSKDKPKKKSQWRKDKQWRRG